MPEAGDERPLRSESTRARYAAQLAAMSPAGAALFKDWLRLAGWSQESEGSLGELLRYGNSTVAVPRELWRDPVVAAGVVERVALAMDTDLLDVLRRLAAPLTDRIEFRLTGQALESGRVPLGAASEALKNGRRLISATGTSAIAPAWSVARRYRPEAQKLARDTELAHTEDGSFVFPLYVTLDRSNEPPLTYDEGSVVPEPYERRVTRTLATAVASAVNLTDRAIDRLGDEELDAASSVGVTRELCMSLDELMKNPLIDEVAINFEWSPAFGSTDALPSSVEVSREIRPQLRNLAKRLARPEPIVSEVYAGPILEIGHSSEEDEEDGFYFVLDTYFRERKSKVRVMLSEVDHDRAIPWYRDRATVIVRGTAQQMKSGLLMTESERVEAWSNTTLSE